MAAGACPCPCPCPCPCLALASAVQPSVPSSSLGAAGMGLWSWTSVQQAHRGGTEQAWKFPAAQLPASSLQPAVLYPERVLQKVRGLSLSRSRENPLSSPGMMKTCSSQDRSDQAQARVWLQPKTAGAFQKRNCVCLAVWDKVGDCMQTGERQQVIALPSHSSLAITYHGAPSRFVSVSGYSMRCHHLTTNKTHECFAPFSFLPFAALQ